MHQCLRNLNKKCQTQCFKPSRHGNTGESHVNKLRSLNKKTVWCLAHSRVSSSPPFSLTLFFFYVAPTSGFECSKHSSTSRVKSPDKQASLYSELRGKFMREECNSPSWSAARGLATATPLFALGRSSLETFYEIPEAARSSVLWPSCSVCKYSLWMIMFGLLDKSKAGS